MASYSDTLPEKYQKLIRRRLRSLRETSGATKRKVPYATEDTVRRWENGEISFIRLMDVYAIAQYKKWTLPDTLAYLTNEDEIPLETDPHLKKMELLLKNMREPFRDTACKLVEQLFTLSEQIEPALEHLEASLHGKTNVSSPGPTTTNKATQVAASSRQARIPEVVFDLRTSADTQSSSVSHDYGSGW